MKATGKFNNSMVAGPDGITAEIMIYGEKTANQWLQGYVT